MIQKKLRGGLHYGSSELENDSISAPRRLPETAKGPLKKGRRIVSQPSFFSEICHLAGCSFWGISVPEVHHHPRIRMSEPRNFNWKHVSVKLLGEPKPPMMWVWFNEQRRPPPGGFWCGDFDVSLIQEFNWKNDHVGSVTTPVTDFCWNGMEFWYFHVWFIFP